MRGLPLWRAAGLALLGAAMLAPPAAADDAAARGKVLFEQCAPCHSLEPGKNQVGPNLHGLFGRKAASEDFVYSPALRRSGVTWTPELLDAFLESPQDGAFRGNRMPFAGIPDPQARADIIAFLKAAP